jgi:hypothetical protein
MQQPRIMDTVLRLALTSIFVDSAYGRSFYSLRTYLSCPFWGKASNFRGLFAFLLHLVATINITYIEKFP